MQRRARNYDSARKQKPKELHGNLISDGFERRRIPFMRRTLKLAQWNVNNLSGWPRLARLHILDHVDLPAFAAYMLGIGYKLNISPQRLCWFRVGELHYRI